MKSQIKDDVVQYGIDVGGYCHCISPDFDTAAIHHFRTTTKKLRSMLRWQNLPKRILPLSFVKIYHVAGDLRNLQILLISLKDEKIKLPDFMFWLARSVGKQQIKWIEMYNKKTFQKLKHNLSEIELTEPERKATKLFFGKRIPQLKAVAELRSPEDEMLHEVRKMVKDMQYVKEWCRNNWMSGNYLTKKFSLEQLKELGKLAGDYNDKRTGLLLLAAYLREEKNEKAIIAAKTIQKRHKLQKARLKKQLLDSIRKFCDQVQPPYFPPKN